MGCVRAYVCRGGGGGGGPGEKKATLTDDLGRKAACKVQPWTLRDTI